MTAQRSDTISTYRRIPADPATWFDASEVAKAKSYQRPLTIANAISLVLNAGLLLAVISTQAAPRLADAVGVEAWPLRLLVVLGGLVVAFTIVDLPVSIWTTFAHERRWGFSTQGPASFVADVVRSVVLGVGIQGPLVLALWWLIRTTPLWWLFGWAVFFAFSVLLAFLYPIVIMPMFNRFDPLDDPELEERLRRLVDQTGMSVEGFFVMDASKRTRKDNAFFAGLGKTRRVVLFDNLLAQSHAVIASVVAHELGHWRRRHVARGIALGALTSLATFVWLRVALGWDVLLEWAGVDALADPASMPLFLLAFTVAGSVTGLIQAFVSRAYERQADLDALEITSDYDAFIETEHGLSTRNLIDLAPSWWRYVRASHPPPAERLELGRRWLASTDPGRREDPR